MLSLQASRPDLSGSCKIPGGLKSGPESQQPQPCVGAHTYSSSSSLSLNSHGRPLVSGTAACFFSGGLRIPVELQEPWKPSTTWMRS